MMFQLRFRPGLCVETALIAMPVLDEEQGNVILLSLLSLSAAFDAISFGILLRQPLGVLGRCIAVILLLLR